MGRILSRIAGPGLIFAGGLRANRSSLVLCVALSIMACRMEPLKAQSKVPSEFEAVYGLALAAPPEIGAQALLRVSDQIEDRKFRAQVIDIAFRMAENAHFPVRLVSVSGTEVDTRSGSVSAALALHLDRLSLQSLAIQKMVVADYPRGRQLFTTLKRPQLPVLSCEDALVPDISPYFDALRAVVGRKSPLDEADTALVTAALTQVSTVGEVAPAARLLTDLPLAPGRPTELALNLFASKLRNLPLDNRSFVYNSAQIDSGIGALVAHARQRGSSPDTLVETYRNMLVAHFTGPHCAASGINVVQPILPANMFGDRIRGAMAPLSEEEMQPKSIDGEITVHSYWNSPKAVQIFERCLELRSRLAAPSAGEAADLTTRVQAFVQSLSTWNPGDEASEEDFYHQQATVYESLLEVAPNSESASRLLSGYLGLLTASPLQKQNSAEWYLHVRRMHERVQAKRPSYATSVLAGYRASGNVSLMLEALIEQLVQHN